jgi:hypothetical protein
MSKRTPVFVSSTVLDLPEHRAKVRDAIDELEMTSIMMETSPAAARSGLEESLRMVDEADVYLGIFAHRYGSVPTDERISITEAEYLRAKATKKDIRVFVIDDDHDLKIHMVDFEGKAKLDDLKQRLLRAHVVKCFRSADDLKAKVLTALSRRPRLGAEAYADPTFAVAVPPSRDPPPARAAEAADAKVDLNTLDLVLASSTDGLVWGPATEHVGMARNGKLKVLVRLVRPASVALLVEPIGTDGQSHGRTLVSPSTPEGPLRAAADFAITRADSWHSLPPRQVLSERVPDKTRSWRLRLFAWRTATTSTPATATDDAWIERLAAGTAVTASHVAVPPDGYAREIYRLAPETHIRRFVFGSSLTWSSEIAFR